MHALLRKLPPSVAALLLQFLALLLTSLGLGMAHVTVDAPAFALLCGSLAAVLGHFYGLGRWWLLIQLLSAPAIVLMLSPHIPSAWFLAALLVMALVYWRTFHRQVPLYLSSIRVWETLEELLPPIESGKNFKFMDIGSGMGGVLTHLAKARPDGQYFGIENAPLPYWLSRARITLGNYSNCHVQWASLWDGDLAQYDVVFAYLSPLPMAQLWQKVQQEMRTGTLFVSNSFAVPHHPPQYSITLDDMQHSTLHIWHMP